MTLDGAVPQNNPCNPDHNHPDDRIAASVVRCVKTLYNMCDNHSLTVTKMVRLNITISDDLAEVLDRMADESQQSKSELLRKALTLFEVARDGKREGKKLALVDLNGHVTTEIVGL